MIPLINFPDIRQSSEYGAYMRQIGWIVLRVKGTQIFIKKIPLLNRSMIKIQHPLNPLPFREIEKIAEKYKPLAIIIEPNVKDYNEAQFFKEKYQKCDWLLSPSATSKIDLQKPLEKIFKSFSESARRNIRKAESNEVRVKVFELKKDYSAEILNDYFNLQKKLTDKKGFTIFDYPEFAKKINCSKNNSILLFAYEKGIEEPIATIWLSTYKDAIFYMHTGISDRGYELLANYKLVWEGVKFAKTKKLKVFDFNSIFDHRYPKQRKSWKNFSTFKSRFHGEDIYFPPVWIKFYNKLFYGLYFFEKWTSRF